MADLKVIDDFLALWRAEAYDYYMRVQIEYLAVCHAEYDITPEEEEGIKAKRGWFRKEDELVTKRWRAKEKYREYYPKWLSQMLDWYGQYGTEYPERIGKILDKEVISKRQALIYRVTKKVGEILDAGGLYIGVNREINGLVVGERGTVRVQTIYAEGPVQRLHYRVLVK